ncbi:collagen alpha-1(I) chain-like [Mustela nigripes]|uniref:collagen alpha-1(I) chain-like n=1 Tax=Mustela nigripes TaxID=77151 RepID=UPI002815124D|nr:collagen alpha-1(I) chain-like [Mustela nigripes]
MPARGTAAACAHAPPGAEPRLRERGGARRARPRAGATPPRPVGHARRRARRGPAPRGPAAPGRLGVSGRGRAPGRGSGKTHRRRLQLARRQPPPDRRRVRPSTAPPAANRPTPSPCAPGSRRRAPGPRDRRPEEPEVVPREPPHDGPRIPPDALPPPPPQDGLSTHRGPPGLPRMSPRTPWRFAPDPRHSSGGCPESASTAAARTRQGGARASPGQRGGFVQRSGPGEAGEKPEVCPSDSATRRALASSRAAMRGKSGCGPRHALRPRRQRSSVALVTLLTATQGTCVPEGAAQPERLFFRDGTRNIADSPVEPRPLRGSGHRTARPSAAASGLCEVTNATPRGGPRPEGNRGHRRRPREDEPPLTPRLRPGRPRGAEMPAPLSRPRGRRSGRVRVRVRVRARGHPPADTGVRPADRAPADTGLRTGGPADTGVRPADRAPADTGVRPADRAAAPQRRGGRGPRTVPRALARDPQAPEAVSGGRPGAAAHALDGDRGARGRATRSPRTRGGSAPRPCFRAERSRPRHTERAHEGRGVRQSSRATRDFGAGTAGAPSPPSRGRSRTWAPVPRPARLRTADAWLRMRAASLPPRPPWRRRQPALAPPLGTPRRSPDAAAG